MIDVNLLGSGGMVPLPWRKLTSLLVRYEGTGVLLDCGEGTQVAIREAGRGFRSIGVILLTHFHADHTAGLPGLLLTIGNSGRTEPVIIAGPKNVGKVVDCLRVIAAHLPYEIRYIEIPDCGGDFLSIGDLRLSACPVEHWVTCFAYRFDLPRQGRFQPEKAQALGIPVRQWKVLQGGGEVEVQGKTIPPGEVLGPPRKGVSLCYATDLRPSSKLADFAKGADLFICEGMYGSDEYRDKAQEHRHCLFSEAARMAKGAGARELWLTHFSPALPNPRDFIQSAADIFPNVFVDKKETVLRFET
ncbi:MAG: ribonuclease Z [Oscillospiraceae bacterium]|nr:ribonuclease Z [Oscillospiraceae bacterium]